MRHELGHRLTPYEEVRDTILGHVPTLHAEVVHLAEAWGRVLATDLFCEDLVPPFDASAMDGYAVHSADLESASESNPRTLPVVATIAAGE